MKPPPKNMYDVVIVGGGIMGLNIAYQLARRTRDFSICILEAASSLGHGSTGSSTGFQRIYYTLPETMRFAITGVEAHKRWKEYTALGAKATANFQETGALWMLGYSKQRNMDMKTKLADLGIDSHVLDAKNIKARFPLLNTDPYPSETDEEGRGSKATAPGELSALYEYGAGYMDPNACLDDMLTVVKKNDVDVKFNARVGRVDTMGQFVTGVTLEDGSKIKAGVVVNAAGPWCRPLTEDIGLKLSTKLVPIRIHVGFKNVEEKFLDLPFVADAWGDSGIYFMPRKASGQLLFSSIGEKYESEEIQDPDKCNLSIDPDVKSALLRELHWRVPDLPPRGQVSGYASMYTVNTDDHHPIIGETRIRGYWVCNGFSGHGFKLSPAVGSLVAQQITGQTLHDDEFEVQSLPLDFYGPYRDPLPAKTFLA